LLIVFILVKDGKAFSPFHDLPLWVDKSKAIANMVVEIPRGKNAKLEISRTDVLNPIKQDVKVFKNPFGGGGFTAYFSLFLTLPPSSCLYLCDRTES
jgi:hypothetical protein